MSKVPRLPPPKMRPITNRAAEEASPAPEPAPPPKVDMEQLEAARSRLQGSILRFKDELKKNTLSANRTVEEGNVRKSLLAELNYGAGELDFINVGEGIMSLAISSLHSAFLLKDEINDLKFQNAVLSKRLNEVIAWKNGKQTTNKKQ